MGHEWACHWAGKRDDEDDDGRFSLRTPAERRRERRASDKCE